jgi:hypothetical protein
MEQYQVTIVYQNFDILIWCFGILNFDIGSQHLNWDSNFNFLINKIEILFVGSKSKFRTPQYKKCFHANIGTVLNYKLLKLYLYAATAGSECPNVSIDRAFTGHLFGSTISNLFTEVI